MGISEALLFRGYGVTGQSKPYVRVYYSILDDPKFADVYDDDAALATWLRLLLIADAMYPAPASLPLGIKRPTLDKLIQAGLVDLGTSRRYRIHGLEAEREHRTSIARKAALAKHEQSGSSANAERTQSNSPAISEPSQDEHNQAAHTPTVARASGFEKVVNVLPDALEDVVSVEVRRLQKLAEELTQQPYAMVNVLGGWGAKAVSEQLPHGYDRVESAWRKVAAQVRAAGTSNPTLRQLVLGADDILNPIPQQDAQEQRNEQQQASYDKRVARTADYIRRLRGEPA